MIDFVLHAIHSMFDRKGYNVLGRLQSVLCDVEVDLSKYNDILALYKDDFERSLGKSVAYPLQKSSKGN